MSLDGENTFGDALVILAPTASSLLDKLSPTERRVAFRVASGKGKLTICKELGLSSKTYDSHRIHVMQKLGLNGDSNANVRLALLLVREGLVAP